MWRDGFDRFFPEYFRHKAENVMKVTRSIFEHLRSGDEFDAQQFAQVSGLKLATVYRVVNEYGIGRLIFGSASEYSQFGNRRPHHYVQTENNVSPCGKILMPDDVIVDRMITQVVIPHWNVENNSPIPDKLLLEALGSPTNSLELDAIIKRLEDAIPDRYKSEVKALALHVAKWRGILCDPKLTPLDGWQRGYTKAIAERYYSACEGKPTGSKKAEQDTGFARATLARTIKDDWYLEPVYGKPVEQDDPDDMPTPHSEHAFYRKVQIYNEDRTFRELDYTKAENRKAAAQALRDGWRVAVVPQTASIPHRKTAEQKAASLNSELSEPRIKRPRKPTTAESRQRAYVGYTEASARRLAITTIQAIGDRVVTQHGEVIPPETLKSSELVQVMLGNAQEVARMYTEPELAEVIAERKVQKQPPSKEYRLWLRLSPVSRGIFERGLTPDRKATLYADIETRAA